MVLDEPTSGLARALAGILQNLEEGNYGILEARRIETGKDLEFMRTVLRPTFKSNSGQALLSDRWP